ncbi:DUF3710 domain-containing protein [Mycobacterium sp. SM1]|uniref:DUF3710 domain-containing protein n=1 Tax=Mycobacterium sp. SM1 TaxID=2816243 RepID=UPI001BD1B071|nr:DUF3710 domain-containing protein [Mycobacterium sp. SM1]
MAFGRRRRKGGRGRVPIGSAGAEPRPEGPDGLPEPEGAAAEGADGLPEPEGTAAEPEGPFDIDDFDDPAAAEQARLDLGSVLIPMPAGGQVQVELTETGVPSAVWIVTPNGRFTIAAYAAPKSGGLWREVAGELADALRRDSVKVTIQDGPWGREVVGVAAGVVRFIGVDGYRWMIRCVVNGGHETIDAVTAEAREALADTVVRRGNTPLPVRTPLPVQLPEPMAAQLRAAAAAQQAEQQPGGRPPAARRSAAGSAMQQLRSSTTG